MNFFQTFICSVLAIVFLFIYSCPEESNINNPTSFFPDITIDKISKIDYQSSINNKYEFTLVTNVNSRTEYLWKIVQNNDSSFLYGNYQVQSFFENITKLTYINKIDYLKEKEDEYGFTNCQEYITIKTIDFKITKICLGTSTYNLAKRYILVQDEKSNKNVYIVNSNVFSFLKQEFTSFIDDRITFIKRINISKIELDFSKNIIPYFDKKLQANIPEKIIFIQDPKSKLFHLENINIKATNQEIDNSIYYLLDIKLATVLNPNKIKKEDLINNLNTEYLLNAKFYTQNNKQEQLIAEYKLYPIHYKKEIFNPFNLIHKPNQNMINLKYGLAYSTYQSGVYNEEDLKLFVKQFSILFK